MMHIYIFLRLNFSHFIACPNLWVLQILLRNCWPIGLCYRKDWYWHALSKMHAEREVWWTRQWEVGHSPQRYLNVVQEAGKDLWVNFCQGPVIFWGDMCSQSRITTQAYRRGGWLWVCSWKYPRLPHKRCRQQRWGRIRSDYCRWEEGRIYWRGKDRTTNLTRLRTRSCMHGDS